MCYNVINIVTLSLKSTFFILIKKLCSSIRSENVHAKSLRFFHLKLCYDLIIQFKIYKIKDSHCILIIFDIYLKWVLIYEK